MNTIKLGSKGEDVKVLQKYLGINPDGNFGPKTLLKVKEWQKSKGLTRKMRKTRKSVAMKNQRRLKIKQLLFEKLAMAFGLEKAERIFQLFNL